jgi:hypothetical protein
MASGVPILSLWTDLAAASGTRVGYLQLWSGGQTTLREDGDDRFTFKLALSDALASSVAVGYVVRAEYLDAETEEWIVQRVTDRYPADVLDVECGGPRLWLADRVLIYDESGATGSSAFTSTGTATEILTALEATLNWPAWVTTGTIDVTDECTLTLSSANGLGAVVGLRDALNDIRTITADPVVFRFRRASASSWVIDLLTSVSAGAYITTGKNLVALAIQQDRTAQRTAIAPVGAGNIMAEEALFRIRYQTAGTGAHTGQNELGIEAIDGKATIVLEDNQFNGQYLVDSAGTTQEILDTEYTAIVSKVWVASSVVAPGTCRLARNSSGDPLLTFPWPSAPTPARVGFLTDTTKARKMNWTFIPGMDQYDSAILRGWTETVLSGSAAFAVESTTYETGASARKFSMASGTALSTGSWVGGSTGYIDGAYRAGTWTIGCRVYSNSPSSGSSRDAYLSIKANTVAQSLVSGISTVNWTSTTSSWKTIEWTFAMTGSADTTFEITVQASLGSSGGSSAKSIVVDRVWLFRTGTDDGDDTLYGSEMTDLIYNANRQMRATAGEPATTYSVDVADLYRDNPSGFANDALAPFTTVRLVVPERSVNETLRVASVTRNLDKPLLASLQLGTAKGRLTTLL